MYDVRDGEPGMEPGMEHPTQDPRDKTIRDLKTDHAGFEIILITRTLLKHRSEQSQSGTFFSQKFLFNVFLCHPISNGEIRFTK